MNKYSSSHPPSVLIVALSDTERLRRRRKSNWALRSASRENYRRAEATASRPPRLLRRRCIQQVTKLDAIQA